MLVKMCLVLGAMVNAAQMKASEQSESFADEMLGDVEALSDKVEMGWRETVMLRLDMMSSLQKFILVAVVALFVVWIVCKLMKSGKGCCKGE